VRLSVGKLGTHLTQSPGPRPTHIPSGILIRPAVWTVLRREGHPIVKYSDICRDLCKTAEPIEMPFWVVESGGPKEACVRWRAH